MDLDYRIFLKTALEERCKRNTRYSLRSFARQLGMSPSHLSRVMSGNSDLSSQSAIRIAQELKLKDNDMELFLDLVNLSSANDSSAIQILQNRIHSKSKKVSRQKLKIEQFALLSEWFCLPIYALSQMSSFRGNLNWIARRLGLTAAEVRSALERLAFFGFIKISDKNKISFAGSGSLETWDDIPSQAIKIHHEQMMKKAILELKKQPVGQREFQGLQLSFDTRHTKAAKEMIREFIDKFESKFKDQSGNELYQLNLQFFSLTQKSENT